MPEIEIDVSDGNILFPPPHEDIDKRLNLQDVCQLCESLTCYNFVVVTHDVMSLS